MSCIMEVNNYLYGHFIMVNVVFFLSVFSSRMFLSKSCPTRFPKVENVLSEISPPDPLPTAQPTNGHIIDWFKFAAWNKEMIHP